MTHYRSTCHSGHIEGAWVHPKNTSQQGDSHDVQTAWDSSSTHYETTRFTPSEISSFKANLYYFGQEIKKETMHKVSSFNANMQLQQAVEKSSNQKWRVQFSTAINADDAHTIDVNIIYSVAWRMSNAVYRCAVGLKIIHWTRKHWHSSLGNWICQPCSHPTLR